MERVKIRLKIGPNQVSLAKWNVFKYRLATRSAESNLIIFSNGSESVLNCWHSLLFPIMIKTVWIRLEPDKINSDVDNRVSHYFIFI